MSIEEDLDPLPKHDLSINRTADGSVITASVHAGCQVEILFKRSSGSTVQYLAAWEAERLIQDICKAIDLI